MRAVVFFGLFLASASALPSSKIVGGEVTTIDQHPSIVSMLYSWNLNNYMQGCGGTIINTRAILTAAHCTDEDLNAPQRWRARVGSTYANSGGVVHRIIKILNHPEFSWVTTDNDIGIVYTASAITYVNNAVHPGTFSGGNYNLPDNSAVWAAGWGAIKLGGPVSEVLRHVQVWTVSQEVCRSRYSVSAITDNMLCSGWLDVGGRDQCQQDSGGPLYHNGVVVGVCSWGIDCASAYYPGVNTRVSRYITWIQANA